MVHRSRPYSELIREAAPLKKADEYNTGWTYFYNTYRQIESELKQAYLKLLRTKKVNGEKIFFFASSLFIGRIYYGGGERILGFCWVNLLGAT